MSALPRSRSGVGDAPCGNGHLMRPDLLSDVLHNVRLSGALFFMWDVAWPYATPVPPGDRFASIVLPGARQVISYHVVTRGSCWGGLVGEQPVQLHVGDILLIPHGDAYVISDSAERCAAARVEMGPSLGFFRQMAAGDLPFVVKEGEGEQSSGLICGFLGCDLRPFNPVLAALPRIVRVASRQGENWARLEQLIDITLAEARQPNPGSRCVLVRLSELLFVEVVRRCLSDQANEKRGWLAGLRDPVVARALLALHHRPANPWTLDTLARNIGASRTSLAERFSRILGQPPMQYLTHWRMQIAARLLSDSSAKIAAIALEVGYASESAFSRAFKRLVGVTPADWRQSARQIAQGGSLEEYSGGNLRGGGRNASTSRPGRAKAVAGARKNPAEAGFDQSP